MPPSGAALVTSRSRLASLRCVNVPKGVAPAYGLAGLFMKLSELFSLTRGCLKSWSYVPFIGRWFGSISRELRASSGVRLSRSRLSFSRDC